MEIEALASRPFTYWLHVADWLLARALERRATRMGEAVPALAPLDDRAELAANEVMTKRLS